MSDDLIKRSDAIEAIRGWFGLIKLNPDILIDAIMMLPSADRPSESIGKLIERMEEYRDKQLLMSDYWYGINWAINTIRVSDIADRPQGEWIDCKEPPSTDRNVFIAYGTDDMKSVCIGHYEHDMKMWYEDKNFFAKPLYDGMYWCEIPQFPAKMKGADDE